MKVAVKRFHELTVDELYRLLKLRADVFVIEQACLFQDLDDCDQKALHIWLEDGGEITAYARVVDRGVKSPQVSIGRVIAARRGCGLGAEVVRAAIEAARGYFCADRIYIEAQDYARGFYERLGFYTISEPFEEDGIMHVKMLL